MKTPTLTILAGLAALPLLVLVAADRLDAQEPAGVVPDRAATEAIVRDYLLENPGVIIEALERWRESEDLMAASRAEEAARANLPLLASGESGHAIGAPEDEAEVIVAEFFDYHCGYCRRAAEFVRDLADEDGVRVVYQDLPILRTESRGAALAGLAAAEAGAYPALHRELMRTSGVLDEDAVAKAAKRADASIAALDDASSRERLESKLTASIDIAREMGLEGTPSFVIASPDGRYVRVVPAYDPDAVEAAVAEARGV